jgi:hypothetical protein
MGAKLHLSHLGRNTDRMFENTVLGRVSVPTAEEVTGGWSELTCHVVCVTIDGVWIGEWIY